MKIQFTDEAVAKLRAIHDFIAKDSPTRAVEMVDRLTRRALQVAELPHAGRMVPEYQRDMLREVLERPYRIIDRIQADGIEVLTVMHYRQTLPADPG